MGGAIWLLKIHLTRTRAAASSNRSQRGEKIKSKVSEREDKRIRGVKMNEGK